VGVLYGSIKIFVGVIAACCLILQYLLWLSHQRGFIMKKFTTIFLGVMLSGILYAADIPMDKQVVDVLSVGTNVVLSSKAPASTYFVVNRVMSQAVGIDILTDVMLRLTTAGGVQYNVPVTNAMNAATNFVVVTPLIPLEVHGADVLTVTGITNANYRISYDIISRGMPKNEGLKVTR